MRKDRRRAKKTTHKLAPDQIKWIREQQGTLSTRDTAKEFARHYHYVHKISASMVHRIWTGKCHSTKACSICSVVEAKSNRFKVSKEMCDRCHSDLRRTKEQAQKRKHQTDRLIKLMKAVEDDDDAELIDLPGYLRKKIIESDDFTLTGQDLARPRSQNRILGSSKHSSDPACREAHSNWLGAVYAIYFIGEPEFEKMVYVGMTTSGVMKRFQMHLSDCRTRKKLTVGNATYKSVLKGLQKENKQTSIRIQLLENYYYEYDEEDEEDEITDDDKRFILDLLEQKWQLRFFLSGYELINASFKVSTKAKLLQEWTRKGIRQWFANPELNDITDVSEVGMGCYVGREVSAGFAWDFQPLQTDDAQDIEIGGEV
jgi:hypothetical protein